MTENTPPINGWYSGSPFNSNNWLGIPFQSSVGTPVYTNLTNTAFSTTFVTVGTTASLTIAKKYMISACVTPDGLLNSYYTISLFDGAGTLIPRSKSTVYGAVSVANSLNFQIIIQSLSASGQVTLKIKTGSGSNRLDTTDSNFNWICVTEIFK